MSNPDPQYFLVRLSLQRDLADHSYVALREFLGSHNWTHILSEDGIVQGLLHCAVGERDLQPAARALVGPRDRLAIECIWPDVVGDRPLPKPKVLRQWLAGYTWREPLG